MRRASISASPTARPWHGYGRAVGDADVDLAAEHEEQLAPAARAVRALLDGVEDLVVDGAALGLVRVEERTVGARVAVDHLRLYIGIADGTRIARVWPCRYSK